MTNLKCYLVGFVDKQATENNLYIQDCMEKLKVFCINKYGFSEDEAITKCAILLDSIYKRAIAQGELSNSLYVRIELSNIIDYIQFDINLEQVRDTVKMFTDAYYKAAKEVAEKLGRAFNECFRDSAEEILKLAEQLNNDSTNVASKNKRGKKGKTLKNWQKNKFYQ